MSVGQIVAEVKRQQEMHSISCVISQALTPFKVRHVWIETQYLFEYCVLVYADRLPNHPAKIYPDYSAPDLEEDILQKIFNHFRNVRVPVDNDNIILGTE